MGGSTVVNTYTLSMEDIIAPGAFGHTRNYGEATPLKFNIKQ